MARRQVRVTIANQAFTLTTSSNSDQEVMELAQTIDDLITGIASRSSNSDTGRIAILACLHLADKLRTAERNLQELREQVDGRSRKLQSLLDQLVDQAS
ncbi:MAG: cell division protein ZapA [Candidatus Solibacter usitatus]|nr:cell division protein ZapA [Candidatus Solibacter usitatus]